ncbi:MAG TPA: dNTP triphosphohydrolase [Firmicutes bacterium]|nr:dNTP triphosphohydrolase [Bacillota bacterium]
MEREYCDYRILYREDLARREELLPSYAARSMETRGRLYPQDGDDPRLAFQRDTDRILHSTAFRRLQYKTQVFVFHEGDFYRTRLTHSLEVAQIGRTLARMLGANEDLVVSISLAHDVGHPPFGHAGEEALSELMAGYGGFEHNLQALRIVDELEERYPECPGLNLTWETREGIARHETFFDAPRAISEFAGFPQPGFEAQISSISDMIAYSTHDLEDALYIGFVTEEELYSEIELWREIAGRGIYGNNSGKVGSPGDPGDPGGSGGDGATWGALWGRLKDTPELRRDAARRFAIRNLIDYLIRDAARETMRRLKQHNIKHPDDVRNAAEPIAFFSGSTYPELGSLKAYLSDKVYNDPRTLRMSNKARMIVRELFNVFLENPGMLPRITQERIKRGQDIHRVIADYISGMTDRHAMDLYNTLFEPYESSLRGIR